MKKHKMVYATVCLALCVGCGEEEEELESGPDPSGTWLQSCIGETDDDGEMEYSKGQYTFTGSNFSYAMMHYGETSGCTSTAHQWSLNFSGTYTTPEQKPDDNGYGIIFTFNSATIEIKLSELITHLNTGLCGKTNWEIDTPTDVSTLEGSTCQWKAHYDLIMKQHNPMTRKYKIEGTSYLEEEDDVFDATKAYTKQ